MATVAEQVQQIYIGLLGRAADQEGATYWEGQINSGAITLDQMRANFVDSQPEYAALVDGLSRSEIITALYQRMFERDPEASGLEYWSTGEGSGVPIDQLSITFMDAAQNADITALENKTTAAIAYTAASGANHTPAAAVTAIDSVGPTQASLDAALTAIAVAFPDPGQTGEAFVLTEDRDNVVGTADNDTFYADVAQNDNGALANALSTGDVIDGGAGTDTLHATIINDNQVDDGAFSSINARTSGVEIVNLSTLDENVIVDAGRMNAVDEFWSDDSDANLILEDVRLGDGQSVTKDITFGLKDVDQQSGLSASFDSQSLTNAGTTTTNSQLLVRIADVSTETPATPLANVSVNLSFDLGSETVTLENVTSTDGTYAGLVTAISTALAADGYDAVSVQLSTAYTQVTFADNTVNLPFTAQEILLSDPNGNAFSNVNFTQSAVAPVAGGFLVAGNAAPVDPSTSTTMIETTVVLDNAGRGSVAGDVVIGGMSNSGTVVEKMNLVVDRDSKIDDLATASGMENNAFNAASYEGYEEIEITSKGANGELSIEDIQDSTVVNANAFAGDKLAINNADALLTLNANIAGDVTVTAATDAGANAYTTGSGDDSLTVRVDGNDVDTDGEGFTANTGSGNDNVTITMTAGVSQETMAELGNLTVNTGAGNDTVNLDAYGNFAISTGAGSDFIRINSEDANGNATTGSWTIGDASASANAFFDERVLYQAKLTVTFAGFEETVDIDTDAAGNFIATQDDINTAIKAAIDANPELSALLDYSDSTGDQALDITSTIGGVNDLAIAIYQPELVASSPADGEVVLAATDLGDLRQGVLATTTTLDSDDLDTVPNAVTALNNANFDGSGANFFGSVAADGTANGTTYTNAQIEGDVASALDNDLSVNDDIFSNEEADLYATFSAGGSANDTSVAGANFSSVNAGSGANDIVVMHSNANSANQLVIDQTFGKVSVVNFHSVSVEDVDQRADLANHGLNFNAFLTDQEDASTNLTGNNDSATDINQLVNLVNGAEAFTDSTAVAGVYTNDNDALANSVNVIRFDSTVTAADDFAGLTAANLVAALNDTNTGSNTDYGNLTGDLLTPVLDPNLVGDVQNHIIMVENDQNEGEYKVFHLTSTWDTATGETTTQGNNAGDEDQFNTTAVELGTLDFGASINFNLTGNTTYQAQVETLVEQATEAQESSPVSGEMSLSEALASYSAVVNAVIDENLTASQTVLSVKLQEAISEFFGDLAVVDTLSNLAEGADDNNSGNSGPFGDGITDISPQSLLENANSIVVSDAGNEAITVSSNDLTVVDGAITLTAAQAAAAADQFVNATDVTVEDTGAAIAGLTVSELGDVDTVDATDNVLTVTLAQAQATTLTAADDNTISGVDSEVDVAAAQTASADTVVVDDGTTLTYTVTEVEALTAELVGDDVAVGANATTAITVADGETLSSLTGLGDAITLPTSAGNAATIDGTQLEVGDSIDLGSAGISGFTDGTDDGAVEITAALVGSDTVFTIETAADGSTPDVVVTVTGLDLTTETIAAGVIAIV